MKKILTRGKHSIISVTRFSDVSAEPLFAFKKKRYGVFSKFIEKNEFVCRKASKQTVIKWLLATLPVAAMFIFTGGICASVGEKFESLVKKPAEIKSSFFHDEDSSKRCLLTVNSKMPLPNDYTPNLTRYMQIECDEALIESLDALLKAAKTVGYDFEVVSGYLPRDFVEKRYNDKRRQLIDDGFSLVRAENMAEKLVSSPRKCEYETGLLIDIKERNVSSEDFKNSDAYKWLNNNCADFGFIQRYSESKKDLTGKPFNPCAYRFVGVENAKKMCTLNMCLEEYIKY